MSLKPSPASSACDGSIFRGISIGADGSTVGEVVFNTAITVTRKFSPTLYCRQIVTLTYRISAIPASTPKTSNREIKKSTPPLIIRDLPLAVSNFRSTSTLDEYLRRENVVGIAGIDTRRLTRILREKGAQNGCLMAGANIDEAAAWRRRAASPAGGHGPGQGGEYQTVLPMGRGEWQLGTGYTAATIPLQGMAYDYGVKRNILRMLLRVVARLPWCRRRPRRKKCWNEARWGVPVQRPGTRSLATTRSRRSPRSSTPACRPSVSAWGTS